MYGYVQVRKPDMKIKEYEAYRGFYCGLCDALGKSYSYLGRMTLSFDMTFLVILLTDIYSMEGRLSAKICIPHPYKKRIHIENEASEYAADMSVILAYQKLLDDMEDERKPAAYAGEIMLRGVYEKAKKRYPEKCRVIRRELKRLKKYERECELNIIRVAGCFGRLLSEIFAYRNDGYERYLRRLGFHLGRFIYIMDAWDDREKDGKSGSYNIINLIPENDKKNIKAHIYDMMEGEMARVARIFRSLPAGEYRGILENIIYAGVWVKYDIAESKEISEKDERSIRGFGDNKICYG